MSSNFYTKRQLRDALSDYIGDLRQEVSRSAVIEEAMQAVETIRRMYASQPCDPQHLHGREDQPGPHVTSRL